MQDTDFWIWLLRENVSGIKTCSQSVARGEAANRVGGLLVIAPAISAARDEQLRNFSLIEIFCDRDLSGRPKRTEREGDVLDFDQLARFQAANITQRESNMYLSSRTRIDIIDKCGRAPRL